MKILFLDDMKSRRDKFKQKSIGHKVDFAETAEDAISLLKTNTYDVIYLDHDLESEHYKTTQETDLNGLYVAKHLLNMIHNHNKIVIVHSLNVVGRNNIKSVLQNKFDVWLPENFKIFDLWNVDVSTIVNAIRQYHEDKINEQEQKTN